MSGVQKDYQPWLFNAYDKLYNNNLSLSRGWTEIAPLEFLIRYFYLTDNYPKLTQEQIITWLSDPENGLYYRDDSHNSILFVKKFGKTSLSFKGYNNYFYKYINNIDKNTTKEIRSALYNFYYNSLQIKAYKELYNPTCSDNRKPDYELAKEIITAIKNSNSDIEPADITLPKSYSWWYISNAYLENKLGEQMLNKLREDFNNYTMPYYMEKLYTVSITQEAGYYNVLVVAADLLNTQIRNDYQCYLKTLKK